MDRDLLVAEARQILMKRQLREAYFRGATFGEPAWEILLHLYVHHRAAEPQPLVELMASLHTTDRGLHRWLKYLEGEGLVNQRGSNDNGEAPYVSLTESGKCRMEDYLKARSSLESY